MSTPNWILGMRVDDKSLSWYLLIFDLPYFTQQFLFNKSPLNLSMFGTMYWVGFVMIILTLMLIHTISMLKKKALPKTNRFICLYMFAVMTFQLIGVMMYLNL